MWIIRWDRKTKIWVGVVLFLLLAFTLILLQWRSDLAQVQESDYQKTADAVAQGPLIQTAVVRKAPEEKTVVLRGEARPFLESVLVPLVNGRVESIRVDRGSWVSRNDVIAVVDSPDISQSYLMAQYEAQARKKLAKHYRALLKQGKVTTLEAERVFAAFDLADANLKVQKKRVDDQVIRAPFDGVITLREVDPGDYVMTASKDNSSPSSIVQVSDTNKLRIVSAVERKYSNNVTLGLSAQVYLPDRPTRKFKVSVSRIAGLLNEASDAMPIELDLDNTPRRIVAGSPVIVELTIPQSGLLTIPSTSLATRNGKPVVAEVLPNRRLKFRPVNIIEDDGEHLTISSGIELGRRVALVFPSNFEEGELVRVSTPAAKPPSEIRRGPASQLK